MAFLAVFAALKIAHRAGGYAGWAWFPTTCDLRRPEHHLVQLKKSVKRNFCSHILIYSRFEFGMTQSFSGQTRPCLRPRPGQKVGESDYQVRHDAGVFRPN